MKKKTVVVTAVFAAVALIALLWAGYTWYRQDIANLEEVRYQLARQGEVIGRIDNRLWLIHKYGCKPLTGQSYKNMLRDNGFDKLLEDMGEPANKGGK